METISLSMKKITKTYPGVIALNDVSVDFIKGEVHALMGENGAGKSTLMKILSGVINPDSGCFEFKGKVYTKITPIQAQNIGIQIVHQELNLVSTLSVTENIYLGSFIGNGITVRFDEMRKRTQQYFDELEIRGIDPDAIVEDLTIAQMQLVEIVKAISRNVEVLILDEPTSPLTSYETELLFKIIENLKKRNVTIIYISHRMSEIYRIADRITVLRDGSKIDTRAINDVSRADLIRMMVGRDLNETYPERLTKPGEVILEATDIAGNGMRHMNLHLRKGEILGLAGLVGAGRTEFARLIYGADKMEHGTIKLEGKLVNIKNPADAVDLGIGLLPEDRKQQGVILDLSIEQNIALPVLKSISTFFTINRNKEKKIVDNHINSLRIKTPSPAQLVGNLSGGNQQKVVVSKWLASNVKVLIFDEPTRGIDVGAKQEIYQLMNQLTERGISIIMISSEMEELIGMSDRILVLREGNIVGELSDRAQFTQENIMQLAAMH